MLEWIGFVALVLFAFYCILFAWVLAEDYEIGGVIIFLACFIGIVYFIYNLAPFRIVLS